MKKIPHFDFRTYKGKYQIIEPWQHSLNGNLNNTVTIHKGFMSNGGSTPSVLWATITPPYHPSFVEEFIVHDYLCDAKQYDRADHWLNVLLQQNKAIPKYKRKMILFGVRFGTQWHTKKPVIFSLLNTKNG